MSVSTATGNQLTRDSSRKLLGFIPTAVLACLLPFVGKAFCIDDPLFMWAARQIQAEPLDFYGCRVNWYGKEMLLADVAKNPPLASYYIAAVTAVCGWSEVALHLGFLVPAIGAILGTWQLARGLCSDALAAAGFTLVSPVFLVSSTNVMCDTLLLACWMWAIVLWKRGLESEDLRTCGFAAVLVSAAALTKYFGMSLIPLLIAYSIFKKRRLTWHLFCLLIPVLVLGAYQWWTTHLYGRGLLRDAVLYESILKGGDERAILTDGLVALSFLGGCCVPVLFCLPWFCSRRWLMAYGTIAAIIVLSLTYCLRVPANDILKDPLPEQLTPLIVQRELQMVLTVQLGLFAVLGGVLLCLAWCDLRKRRDADAVLLALWIGGTFAFAGLVNWSCNGRSLLPLAPAAGIVLVRRLEDVTVPGENSRWKWALLPAAMVGLVLTWGDVQLANTAWTAADRVANLPRGENATIWFEGHWGFQYYMESHGARPLAYDELRCAVGDLLVVPQNNTNLVPLPPQTLELVEQFEIPVLPWATTMHTAVGAGFYSDLWGPLPFAFGRVPPERYTVWRFTRPLESRNEP